MLTLLLGDTLALHCSKRSTAALTWQHAGKYYSMPVGLCRHVIHCLNYTVFILLPTTWIYQWTGTLLCGLPLLFITDHRGSLSVFYLLLTIGPVL
jgi:hypothetical protein